MGDLNTFDAACYLARYPDVRSGWPGTAEEHWEEFGQIEGRVPGCDPDGTIYSDVFDAVEYLRRYPDVRQNWKGDPYLHWVQFGRAEGRHPGAVFYPGSVEPVDTTPPALPPVTVDPTEPTPSSGSGKILLYLGLAAGAAFLLKRSRNQKTRS